MSERFTIENLTESTNGTVNTLTNRTLITNQNRVTGKLKITVLPTSAASPKQQTYKFLNKINLQLNV